MKLCLGTVQFGMKYGIRNQIGRQPSWEESFAMLDEAIDAGIDTIDTARAYGDAELVIGEWLKGKDNVKDIKIISKLRPNVIDPDETDVRGVVEREITDSLARLGINKLNGYLLHTPEYIFRSEIIDAMCHIKEKGYTDNIGISIYGTKEGEAALNTGIIDYLQMPYSIFDQRGTKTGLLAKCKAAGVKTFARSAFLQGLILMSKEEVPEHLSKAKDYIDCMDSAIEPSGIDKVHAAIHFVKNEEHIDYLVFGVEKMEQLVEDIHVFSMNDINTEYIRQLNDEIGEVEEAIILPSLWSNGKRAD